MHNKKYWVAFGAIEKISSAFIKCVYDYCEHDIERAWNISVQELKLVDGLKSKSVENFIEERNKINPDEKLDVMLSKSVDVLAFDDALYPELLKQIPNPPMTLFFKGNLSGCNFDRAFAVVGSRNISLGAKDNIKKIFKEFKNSDLLIVSGGAAGADTCAHEAAIENNMKTIAVLGSGFDKIYPAKNKRLFEEIVDNSGLLMSEYWMDFAPIAWRFPARNRIVAGMSYGTLIAEAALKSGALITANLALEFGRELMCIPGAINNPNTQGIYKLLKQGAGIVTNAQDILDFMNWELCLQKSQQSENFSELSEFEREVLQIISKDCLTIDDIFNTLSIKEITLPELMTLLTTMEISGYIKTDELGRYTI